MKDRSDDPSQYERTLLPRSYISLLGTRNSSMGPPYEGKLHHRKSRPKFMPRRKKMFYLTTHSTHFIYGYMASDIWLRTILIVRKETRCRHIGYSFRLTTRVLLYTSHPTDKIAHTTAFVTPVVVYWLEREIAQWVHPTKDRRNDPSHHERTLVPRSYISLHHEGSIRRPIAP